MLNGIGFGWNVHGDNWMKMYQCLVSYKRKYGTKNKLTLLTLRREIDTKSSKKRSGGESEGKKSYCTSDKEES